MNVDNFHDTRDIPKILPQVLRLVHWHAVCGNVHTLAPTTTVLHSALNFIKVLQWDVGLELLYVFLSILQMMKRIRKKQHCFVQDLLKYCQHLPWTYEIELLLLEVLLEISCKVCDNTVLIIQQLEH